MIPKEQLTSLQRRYTEQDQWDPYAETLGRYAQIVGHTDPLPLNEAVLHIMQATGGVTPYLKVCTTAQLRRSIDRLRVDGGVVPPDLTVFTIDERMDETELKDRFGWNRISLLSAQRVMQMFISQMDRRVGEELETQISTAYPTTKNSLQNQETYIPARYFLDAFSSLMPVSEQAGIENGIKKYGFSPTEVAILLGMARGLENQEICSLFSISSQTAKNHVKALLEKMNASKENDVYDRSQAAILAIREGIFPQSVLTRLPEADKVDHLIRLSPQKRAVLQYISQGMANKEIAMSLVISSQTVKNHITAILNILDCTDRLSAMLVSINAQLQNGRSLDQIFPPSLSPSSPNHPLRETSEYPRSKSTLIN